MGGWISEGVGERVRVGGDHQRSPGVHGWTISSGSMLQVDRGHAQVAVPELALDDVQWHALAQQLMPRASLRAAVDDTEQRRDRHRLARLQPRLELFKALLVHVDRGLRSLVVVRRCGRCRVAPRWLGRARYADSPPAGAAVTCRSRSRTTPSTGGAAPRTPGCAESVARAACPPPRVPAAQPGCWRQCDSPSSPDSRSAPHWSPPPRPPPPSHRPPHRPRLRRARAHHDRR